MSIQLSEVAVSEIKRQRDQMGMAQAFLRIGIQRGCCGSSYALGLDTDSRDDDMVFDFDGLKVAVDSQSFPMVDGRKLDFVNGPMGMGFKFEGPALEGKMGDGCGGGGCGCGNGGGHGHGHEEMEEAEAMSGGGCGSGGGGCGCSH